MSAAGSPSQAVPAGVGAGIAPGVAADTQSGGVVVGPRATSDTVAGQRATRPAREAERDSLHRDRVGTAHAVAGEPTSLSSRGGHCGDYAGGRLRLRPNRGVTFDVAGPGDGFSPLLALTTSGRRAATASPSTVSKSLGALQHGADHVEVLEPDRGRGGCPEHRHLARADLQPGSASSRRISTDFQIPRSAAFIRFHCIASSSIRRVVTRWLAWFQACSMCSLWTWTYRVVVDSQGIAQLLNGFQTDALGIQRRGAVVPQPVGISRRVGCWSGSHRATACRGRCAERRLRRIARP